MLRPSTETVKSTERYTLLIGGRAWRRAELLAGQSDEAAEVPLPQLLGRNRVAGLEPVNPLGDRHVGAHAHRPGKWSSCERRWIVIVRNPLCKDATPMANFGRGK